MAKFKNLTKKKKEPKKVKIPFIIAMNLAEHKFYTYSENGLMINRFDYSDWVKLYGEPIATSTDGQNFIFKNKRDDIISIIYLDERELTLIKTLDISVEVDKYLLTCSPEIKNTLYKEQKWLKKEKELEYDFSITNEFDVIVRINKMAK